MKFGTSALLPLAAILLAACDSATSAGGAADVRIQMGARSASSLSASGATRAVTADGPLVLSGDNGELTIDDLRVVVAEFELKGDDDLNPCERAGGADDCEDFDAGPLFIDLPLTGASTVSTGTLPPGTYREIDFEVEDLDDGEEEAGKAARIQALLQQIRAEFPDWPRDASMLVVGSFRPLVNGALGTAVPFRVFIRAEVEVELPLSPPMVVTGDGTENVTVTLDPALLFRSGTRVADLSRFSGQLLEWEVEDGFRGEHSGHR